MIEQHFDNSFVDQTMKKYELGFLLKEEDSTPVKRILEKYISIYLTGKQVELFESPLVKINLAYPIKKQNQAFFGYFNFEFAPEKVAEFNHELKLEPSLLRHLLIKLPSFAIKKEMSREKKGPVTERSVIKKREPKTTVPMLTNEALEKLKEEILK